MVVARNIGGFKYDPSKSFKGWLLNTARWKIQDQLRKRISHERDVSRDDTRRTSTIDRLVDPRSVDLDELCEKEWKDHIEAIALARIKARVNPKHYQIFDYYVPEGMAGKKGREHFACQ